MPVRQITTVASQTALSIRRRLSAASAMEAHRRDEPDAAQPADADDARLDTLRGELVRELDRLAAADVGCSAGFRRI